MADGVTYSFPVLTSKKIVGYLSDLKIHISEEVNTDTRAEGEQLVFLGAVHIRGVVTLCHAACGVGVRCLATILVVPCYYLSTTKLWQSST